MEYFELRLGIIWNSVEKVLELSSQGLNQSEIATVLKVTQPTVNKDLTFIKKQATANLQRHVQETLPHEYQKCMVGINQVLKMCWSIISREVDDKTKLQALALVNDCNKYKMDLTTNGVVITDAIKYIQGQMDHLNKSEKALLQDIKQKEDRETEQQEDEDIEQQKTTNGIF